MSGHIWGLDGLIDIEQKVYEWIECGIAYMTLNFDLNHNFDLGFSKSNFEIFVYQEYVVRLTWNEMDINQ